MTDPRPADPPPPQGFWRATWGRLKKHRSGMFGVSMLALLALVAFLSPVLANDKPLVCKYQGEIFFPALVDVLHQVPFGEDLHAMPKPFRFPQFSAQEYYAETQDDANWATWPPVPYGPNQTAPLRKLEPPSAEHRLGTDEIGRDVMSRMLHATPIAILIGFVSMGIAAVIGIIMGCVAGYLGGWWDIALSRIIEVFICVPVFYVILICLLIFEPSIWNIMVVIGLFAWTGIARYTRGEMMKLKGLDYALAARALGASAPRIIFRHLMPNALAPVLVVVAFGVAGAIFTETGLSWLGFGVQPPEATWGNILRSGWDNLRIAPHLMYPPSIAVFFTVLVMNLIGDALRDVTDPRLVSSAS